MLGVYLLSTTEVAPTNKTRERVNISVSGRDQSNGQVSQEMCIVVEVH